MIIEQDRSMLDEAINPDGDPNWIVLLLSGAEGGKARAIHDLLEEQIEIGSQEPWRKHFLITDLDVLKESEQNAWFGGSEPEQYAVLRQQTKEVALTGPVSDLLDSSEEPDILTISDAFSEGRGDIQ